MDIERPCYVSNGLAFHYFVEHPLAGEGYPIQPEDVARLSPLVFEHINLLGRYAFSVPDSVVRGQLQPLRNPADALEDVA